VRGGLGDGDPITGPQGVPFAPVRTVIRPRSTSKLSCWLRRRCVGGRPAELRDTLHLPAQTITSVLDQLQAAGLVSRSPHPSDRRSTIAKLTSAGRQTIDRICPPLIDIEADCMSALSQAEQDQLISLLTKIQERIAQRRL